MYMFNIKLEEKSHCVKVRTLQVQFGQIINKHLGMNTSINLVFNRDASTLLVSGMPTQEKIDKFLDKLTV